MMTMLEAIAPTTILFCVGYKWNSRLGELEGNTVVDACDAETALRRLKSQNPHVTQAWIIEE